MTTGAEHLQNTAPTLVDKVINTLLDPEIQTQIYTVLNVDIDPLGSFHSMGRERIRFAVAPQSPTYNVDQLNNALSAVNTTIRTDHGIEEGTLQPINEFRFLWIHYFWLGYATYLEKDAIIKTTKTSSSQPTPEVWKQFGVEIPIYDPKIKTFDREVCVVMYPDKKLAEDSFKPETSVRYSIGMGQFRAREKEFNKSGLLI